MSSIRNEKPEIAELREKINIAPRFERVVTDPIHAELDAILKEPDMRQQSNRLLIDDPATRTRYEDKLRTIIANDDHARTVNTAGMSLVELLEIYVYSTYIQTHQMSTHQTEIYIAKRALHMSAVIGIEYDKILRQLTRYRAYKTAIRDKNIFHKVGLNASQFSGADFINPSEAKQVKDQLMGDIIARLAHDNKFSEVSQELQDDITTILAGTSTTKNREVKDKLKQADEDVTTARDALLKKLQEEKSKDMNTSIPSLTLARMGKELKKYNDTQKIIEKLRKEIDNPTLTLANYRTVLSRTPAEQPIFYDRISGAIKDYVESTTESYIQRMNEHSKQLQHAKEGEVQHVKTSYGNIFEDWPHLKDILEVENSLNTLMGVSDNKNEKWIKLKPGAWFELQGKHKGKDVTFFDEIASITKDTVTFKKTGKTLDLKILVGYLLHPKYPSTTTNDLKVKFIHDSEKAPMNTLRDLEKRIGYRNVADNSSKPLIEAGNVIISFDKTAQQAVPQDSISSVNPFTRTIILKGLGPLSYDEFLLYAKKYNWTIENGDSIEGMDSRVKSGAGGIGFVSVLSFGKAVMKRFDKWGKDRKDKRERDLLISMVYQFPKGSKFWKDACKDLAGKESGEVDTKIEELKGKHINDGARGKAINDFFSKKINITKFEDRVEAKAMLQWTLSTYGTLYPNEILKDWEKQRKWMEIFSETPKQRLNAQEDSKKKNDPVNGMTEYNQLFSLFNLGEYEDKVLAGSFGSSYASKMKGLKDEGVGNSEKGKNEQMSAALDVAKIMEVVRDTIKNQQWGALKAVFEKLATKNYPIATMTNLFVYAFDQLHYKDGIHHRCKMPFQELQGLAKTVAGGYNLPFFVLIQKTENFQLGCDLLYENPYITGTYWNPGGEWGTNEKGMPVPPGAKGQDLHKALNMLDGHTVLLTGISKDKDNVPVSKAETDLRDYRNLIYNGNMPNVQYNVVTKDVEKSNWSKNPLYTALNGHSFSQIVSFTRRTDKSWSKEEAGIYMDAVIKEFKNLNNSSLSEADKQYVRARFAAVLYEEFWNDASWWKEDGDYATERSGRRRSNPNRDFFISNYGEKLYKLGISYELGKATSDPDNKEEEIIWTDHFPIDPQPQNVEYYKSKMGAGITNLIDWTSRRVTNTLNSEQARQTLNAA